MKITKVMLDIENVETPSAAILFIAKEDGSIGRVTHGGYVILDLRLELYSEEFGGSHGVRHLRDIKESETAMTPPGFGVRDDVNWERFRRYMWGWCRAMKEVLADCPELHKMMPHQFGHFTRAKHPLSLKTPQLEKEFYDALMVHTRFGMLMGGP